MTDKPEKKPTLQGKSILLVEDEYFLVQDMAQAFLDAGAGIVGPAASVADALRLVAAATRVDGAVLDINLRGEMVYPLADMLHARGIPFVFATGYDRESIPERFDGHLRCEKPVRVEKVADALFGGMA
jgi:CheY-like chemotaxis protein